MVYLHIPGRRCVALRHLVLDLNGTLTVRGRLVEGAAERLEMLSSQLSVCVITADTRATAAQVVSELGVHLECIERGVGECRAKAQFVRGVGASSTAAIGNGHNDRLMLAEAAVGFAIIQGEGASRSALEAADGIFPSVCDALDAIIDPAACVATLRD